MGIIKRLYHRSDGLTDNRYNSFMIDMGENIHIHYRDLRIELSVSEFLEFADLCDVYLPQVKAEIEGGYQDGIHPNTNQTNTWKLFSNKLPLNNNITYTPNRISLEENLDGYHLHIRNYKILLDKPSFVNFAKAAKDILDKSNHIVDLQEVLELIETNDLNHYVNEIIRNEDHECAIVTVEKPYYKKLLQLLNALSFKNVDIDSGSVVYERDNVRIYLKAGPLPKSSITNVIGSQVVPLAEFIKKNAERFSAREFNILKLHILDFFERARKNRLEQLVEFDYRKLIYDTARQKVIFPAKEHRTDTNLDQEYNRLLEYFRELGLSFAKPGKPEKIPYADDERQRLQAVFDEHLKKHLAAYPCVSNIHLLNAESKKRQGCYEVPFVHFNWAKLGSDFDLLIEIDEDYDVPPEWKFQFFWKVCGSDYYHLGDVDFPIRSPYIEQFPNIDFHHHMVEAYLFFPSKGDADIKNAYLKKFKAKELYKKEPSQKKPAAQLRASIKKNYGIPAQSIEALKTPSFNEIFRVKTKDGDYAAKIMKNVDFIPAVKGHSGKHIEYESKVLQALSGKNLPVVTPIIGKDGKTVQAHNECYCMLFPFLESDVAPTTQEGKIKATAKTLALLHKNLSGIDAATDLYRFNEVSDYWIEQYTSLYNKYDGDTERHAQFESLIPGIKQAKERILAATDLMWLHAHGDICPQNFFYVGEQAILFDFQVAHYGPRIMDLAEGALEFAWHGAVIDRALTDTFVTSYQEENSLTDADRDLLPTMMFLMAAFKLARSFRVEVLFGYKVNKGRISAFLEYALANQKQLQ